MIGKEYLGDEKTKRILSGEPFWCCAAFIDSDGLQIIEPRESQVHMNWYNSFTKTKIEDLEHRHMLYGYPIKNVSVFDSEQDCREKFMTMLGVLEYKTVKICYQKIDELIQVKKKDVEEIRKHINKDGRTLSPFSKGGYTAKDAEKDSPFDVNSVRNTIFNNYLKEFSPQIQIKNGEHVSPVDVAMTIKKAEGISSVLKRLGLLDEILKNYDKKCTEEVCERKKQQSLKYLLEEAKEQIDSQDSFIAFIEMFDKSLADKIRKAQEQVND